MTYPNKDDMWLAGIARAEQFCNANGLVIPHFIRKEEKDWPFGTCAYYRMTPDGKGNVVGCVKKMAHVGVAAAAWSYPGYVADRTPFGVIAHEIGHHVDYLRADEKQGPYFSDFSRRVKAESGEKPITSYAPNDHEWFAEMMRLFITNPVLLAAIRPKTYVLLFESGLRPVEGRHWAEVLKDAPQRTQEQARKKAAF